MAKCFDVVGYIEPCNAVRQKYTGRALLIVFNTYSDIIFSTNGLSITSIFSNTDWEEFYNQVKQLPTVKCLPVSVSMQNPFGVTVQGNTDSGRVMYTKTIPVSIPATRDGKAEEFIMGLQKGINVGSCVLVLEAAQDAAQDAANNDFFGAYCPVYLDPASVTRSEYESGGAWTFNLICEEPVPNVGCTLANLGTVLDTLNA